MVVFPSRWPVLLCMTTILLSWWAPLTAAKNTKTSEVYKVLTDKDNVGGSCSSRMAQVDALVPEVQEVVEAAIDSIDKLLSDPTELKSWTRSKTMNRMRLLLLARWFVGAEFDEETLKLKGKDPKTGKDSKKTLKEFKEEFTKIQTKIGKKNHDYRIACNDTWVEKVTKLKTNIGDIKKDTPIAEISSLNGGGNKDWAWFDRGGPDVRPAKNNEDADTQRSWYMTDTGWSQDGPCAPRTINGEKSIPFATVYAPLKIITYCHSCWDQVGKTLMKDMRELKNMNIAIGGSQYLDAFRTPGMILLNEMIMTNPIFKSENTRPTAFGYGFKNIIKGKDDPDGALSNADTYTFFAMAAYLDKVQWHTGKAQEIGTR